MHPFCRTFFLHSPFFRSRSLVLELCNETEGFTVASFDFACLCQPTSKMQPSSTMLTNCCIQKGWLWNTQEPQMAHMNVLDLAVFPGVSNGHTTMHRSQHALRVLKPDGIWAGQQQQQQQWRLEQVAVPQNCPSIHPRPNKISKRVIKNDGDNKLMRNGGSISVEVMKDAVPFGCPLHGYSKKVANDINKIVLHATWTRTASKRFADASNDDNEK